VWFRKAEQKSKVDITCPQGGFIAGVQGAWNLLLLLPSMSARRRKPWHWNFLALTAKSGKCGTDKPTGETGVDDELLILNRDAIHRKRREA